MSSRWVEGNAPGLDLTCRPGAALGRDALKPKAGPQPVSSARDEEVTPGEEAEPVCEAVASAGSRAKR